MFHNFSNFAKFLFGFAAILFFNYSNFIIGNSSYPPWRNPSRFFNIKQIWRPKVLNSGAQNAPQTVGSDLKKTSKSFLVSIPVNYPFLVHQEARSAVRGTIMKKQHNQVFKIFPLISQRNQAFQVKSMNLQVYHKLQG